MVYSGCYQGSAGRLFQRQGIHGPYAVWILHLGEHQRTLRPKNQRDRAPERLLSPSHTRTVTEERGGTLRGLHTDRKSTRLNSSHTVISYAVFCLKKKTKKKIKRKTGTTQQKHVD